jgi:hypothetical protein
MFLFYREGGESKVLGTQAKARVRKPAEWQFQTRTPDTIVRGVHIRALFHRNSAIFYRNMHDVYALHMLLPCRFSGCVLDTPVRVGPRYIPQPR